MSLRVGEEIMETGCHEVFGSEADGGYKLEVTTQSIQSADPLCLTWLICTEAEYCATLQNVYHVKDSGNHRYLVINIL